MSKIRPDRLLISSDFFSIQGEGLSTGIPSYFIRLGLCNLTCGMSNKFLNQLVKDKNVEDGELFIGDLEAEGKATWTCDSTSQWAFRGVDQEFQYLIDRWKEQGLYRDITGGIIHIIFTGGEPAMVKHQESIENFFEYWRYYDGFVACEEVYSEIETNGTVYLNDFMFEQMNQINCSPKLANSGMSEKQRIKPDVIKQIMTHDNYQFKFVISSEDDVKEIFRDFIEPFNIPLKNVVCMPALETQDEFHERTRFVLEMAKKYRFRGLTRLHISAWNLTLNV